MAWTRIASRAEVEEKTLTAAEINGADIAPYWVDGQIFATDNVCTHAYARLSEGYLDGECVECPIHQALFNVKTGAVVSEPAEEPLKTHPCRVEGDDVLVDLSGTAF